MPGPSHAWMPVHLAGTAIALAAATVGACSGLHSDAHPTQVYTLRALPADGSSRQPLSAPQAAPSGAPPSTPRSPSNPAELSIRVSRPMAGPGLDTDHIVIIQSDHRMSYYTASRWAAALPDMVETLAVQTLRDTGSWTTVQGSGTLFPPDYLLQVVIRSFEADYSANAELPQAHVILDCTLGRRAGRELITSFVAEGSAIASANRLGPVVSAFETATNQALAQMATRTYAAVREAQKVDSPVPSMTR